MAKDFATSPDEQAPCFRPWLNDPTVWRKIVTDSNAVAQEAGIGALCKFIEYGGTNAAHKYVAPRKIFEEINFCRTRGIVVPAIVEKCLSSARAGTKTKAIEAILLYVEVDVPDPVLVSCRQSAKNLTC